jgi:hypothetical protein
MTLEPIQIKSSMLLLAVLQNRGTASATPASRHNIPNNFATSSYDLVTNSSSHPALLCRNRARAAVETHSKEGLKISMLLPPFNPSARKNAPS